jgi:DNA polymerase-3 subunit gamma/tau
MPDPGALVRKLENLAINPPPVATADAAAAAPGEPAAPAPGLPWKALVECVDQSGQLRVAQIMHDWVRVVALTTGELKYAVVPGFSGDPTADMREALQKATGERWTVEQAEGEGVPSLRELADAIRADAQAALRRAPLVAAVLDAFPAAEFITEEEHGSPGAKNWSKRA